MRLLYSLCFLCSLPLLSGQEISYEAGFYTRSCTQICSGKGLLCGDSQVESMNCAAAASSYCGASGLTSNANVGCTVAGCYVNCKNRFYYGKSSGYSSCNVGGSCLITNLNRICPCYEEVKEELEEWAYIGLYLAVGIVLLALGGVGYKFVLPRYFQQRDDDDDDEEALYDSVLSVDDSSGKTKKTKKVKKKKTKSRDVEMDETRDMAIK